MVYRLTQSLSAFQVRLMRDTAQPGSQSVNKRTPRELIDLSASVASLKHSLDRLSSRQSPIPAH